MNIILENISAYFYNELMLSNISLELKQGEIIALVGPYNSGKSTFLKLFNRLDEIQKGFRVEGNILLENESIYDLDIYELRRNVGIIFSKPAALPGSVYDNLTFGLTIQKVKDKELIFQKIKDVLERFDLWDELKDDLEASAQKLSNLKLQILSIARVLVLNPTILLFEDPTKNLTELAARKLEAIIMSLKQQHTIIIKVTNTRQARRLSDSTIFLYNGNLIEFDRTPKLFTKPAKELTENFVRGRLDLL